MIGTKPRIINPSGGAGFDVLKTLMWQWFSGVEGVCPHATVRRLCYNWGIALQHFPMSEPFVRLENVRFAYGERAILRDISLSIPRGKVVAIMGGSGCGKTTLLRLIGGQEKAVGGRVVVDGQDVAGLGREALYALRRRMGMLFQFGALFTDMTVFDNVAFPLREHTDLPPELIDDLVLMKLHAVGLRGAARLMPGELSGGMARRVALARTIALDPALLMYDEPFTGLDPISLGVIGQLIRRLNDALGASSVIVTPEAVVAVMGRSPLRRSAGCSRGRGRPWPS